MLNWQLVYLHFARCDVCVLCISCIGFSCRERLRLYVVNTTRMESNMEAQLPQSSIHRTYRGLIHVFSHGMVSQKSFTHGLHRMQQPRLSSLIWSMEIMMKQISCMHDLKHVSIFPWVLRPQPCDVAWASSQQAGTLAQVRLREC